MPRLAEPAGSDEAREPIAVFGNLVKVSIIRFLRANPDVRAGAICAALGLGPTTVQPYLLQLEAAGLVVGDPPTGGSRRGLWVTYRLNSEDVTDLYLRLGAAIGER